MGWTCSRCGHQNGSDARFCGRCGRQRPREPSAIEGRGLRGKAIFLGALTAFGFSLGLGFILGFTIALNQGAMASLMVESALAIIGLSNLLSLVIGGFIAGRLAPASGALNGAVAAALAGGIGLLLTTLVSSVSGIVVGTSALIGLFIGGGIGALGGWLGAYSDSGER